MKNACVIICGVILGLIILGVLIAACIYLGEIIYANHGLGGLIGFAVAALLIGNVSIEND